MLVINNNKEITIKKIKTKEGRSLLFEITINHINIAVASFYAPAKSNQRFKWIQQNLYPEELLEFDLVIGDFNINQQSTTKENQLLHQTIDESSLEEISPSGTLKTSFQGSKSRALLDRAFVSPNFKHWIKEYTIQPRTTKSDHDFQVIDLNLPATPKSKKKRNLIWKLNTATAKLPNTIERIEQVISNFKHIKNQQDIEVKNHNKAIHKKILNMEKANNQQHQHLLEEEIRKEKIKKSKILLTQWLNFKSITKKTYMVIEKQTINCRFNLKKKLIKELENANQSRQNQIRFQLKEIELEVEKDNMIKNSINYLNNKEIPSTYLSGILKKKKQQQSTPQIIHPTSGNLVTEDIEIRDAFKCYYQDKIYKKVNCDDQIHRSLLKHWNTSIPEKTKQQLSLPITEEEIKAVILQSTEGSAPGEDGLTITFYKNHLNSLLPLLKILFNNLFKKGVPAELKKGILISIYKEKGDINDIANRRPITLLNVDYKLFSKILNNRILSFLPKIVSKYQNGFVPGRLLHDNIISLDMVFEQINKKSKKSKPIYIPQNHKETLEEKSIRTNCYDPVITFYDFEKAFDSISHKSIERTLQHLQLPSTFINAVLSLLTESQVRVSVDGQLSESFYTERGTKQGDPISPTLFALVCECMSATIRKINEIKGLPLSENDSLEPLKIIQFADDTCTTARNPHHSKIMDSIINLFCKATAAKVNQNKCMVIKFNQNGTSNNYKYPLMEHNGQERYLGFNFNHKGINSKVDNIAQSIKNHLHNWQNISGTLMGKITILKTYCLSKLTFHLYVNDITDTTNKQLAKSTSMFLYNNESGRRKISHDRSIKDYQSSGLNLWDLQFRASAQKAWIFERYLTMKTQPTPQTPIYHNDWSSQITNNKPSRILLQSFNSWLKLFPTNQRKVIRLNNQLQPFGHPNLKLKELYRTMLDQNKQNWNKYTPTEGQCKIQTSTSQQILDFESTRKIIHPKGRDLVWRYQLKAIRKIYDEDCPVCKMPHGNSEHIFFSCPSINSRCQSIMSNILNALGHQNRTWEQRILNLLHIPIVANTIAILFDLIWYKRNQIRHENTNPPIMYRDVLKKLKLVQMAIWTKKKNSIDLLIRKQMRTSNVNEISTIKAKIKKTILHFKKDWSNILIPFNIPDYIIRHS